MAAGYGVPETAESKRTPQYFFEFCNKDQLNDIEYFLCAPKREVYLNIGSAAVAGAVAGVIGTVVSLSILIPLAPVLAPLGLSVGV